ncbi:MAG: hypothetical protein MJZ26_10470 [Fibrobacter sp.]|nr:hypothetical protein [Fibrobacter sp.]
MNKFEKIALGSALVASFGLVACGDDSSSGAGSFDDSKSCKVIDDGKTIGFEYSMYGVGIKETMTFNKDGSITEYFKESLGSGISKAELELACKKVKEDMDGEEFDSFKCGDGVIEYKATEKDADVSKEAMEMARFYAQSECAMFNGEDLPEMPGFSSGDDDDEDDDDDDKKLPGSSSKEDCSFKMDSDTWSYGYYNIGLGGDMTKTYTISGNEYKILYTYKGESLDAQSTSGKFSDSYTRKDMFNEAQDHCLTVNGLKDSSDDEDDDDDYESPVGSDDDDDSEEPAIDDPDSPLESSDYTCDIPEDGDKWVISYKNEDMVTETVYTFEGKTMLTSIRVISPVSDCSMYEDAKPTDGSTYSCKDGMLTKTFVAEETEDVDKAFQYKIVKATCAG